MENIFLEMIIENIDNLRSGKLSKSKFIGKYMAKINEVDKQNAFRYKRPQIIGEGTEADNNWLDYISNMNEEELIYFKEAINNEK